MWRKTFVNYKYRKLCLFFFGVSRKAWWVTRSVKPFVLYISFWKGHICLLPAHHFLLTGDWSRQASGSTVSCYPIFSSASGVGKTEIVTALPYLGAWLSGTCTPLQGYPQTQMCSGESEDYKLGYVLSLKPAFWTTVFTLSTSAMSSA